MISVMVCNRREAQGALLDSRWAVISMHTPGGDPADIKLEASQVLHIACHDFCNREIDGQEVTWNGGDPIVWGEKLVAHYKKLGIDPKTKMAVFSDGLNIPKCVELYDHFKDKIGVSFGVGTDLTNCIGGITPINIVIKMTKCNGQDVAKVSDSPGKNICSNPTYVNYLKQAFGI